MMIHVPWDDIMSAGKYSGYYRRKWLEMLAVNSSKMLVTIYQLTQYLLKTCKLHCCKAQNLMQQHLFPVETWTHVDVHNKHGQIFRYLQTPYLIQYIKERFWHSLIYLFLLHVCILFTDLTKYEISNETVSENWMQLGSQGEKKKKHKNLHSLASCFFLLLWNTGHLFMRLLGASDQIFTTVKTPMLTIRMDSNLPPLMTRQNISFYSSLTPLRFKNLYLFLP